MMARVRINNFEVRTITTLGGKRLCRRVMDEVFDEARRITLKGPYVTGQLANSLYKDGPHVAGKDVFGEVGASADHAVIVHDGAEIHDIFPKSARQFYRFFDRSRPQLKFFWRRIGRVIYLPHIPGAPSRIGRSHPGQKGKKFLTNPLREAAARHNMRYIP